MLLHMLINETKPTLTIDKPVAYSLVTQICWAHSGLYAPLSDLQPTAGLPPKILNLSHFYSKKMQKCAVKLDFCKMPFFSVFVVYVLQKYLGTFTPFKNTRLEKV